MAIREWWICHSNVGDHLDSNGPQYDEEGYMTEASSSFEWTPLIDATDMPAKEEIRLRAGLIKLSEIVDEALLLDEHLAEAWGELRSAVVEARELLEEEGEE